MANGWANTAWLSGGSSVRMLTAMVNGKRHPEFGPVEMVCLLHQLPNSRTVPITVENLLVGLSDISKTQLATEILGKHKQRFLYSLLSALFNSFFSSVLSSLLCSTLSASEVFTPLLYSTCSITVPSHLVS